MAVKPVPGVAGVLGELVGPSKPKADRPEPRSEGRGTSEAKPRSRRARLGRPPGKSAGAMGPKEKVTLRIDAQLMADYRDWSWEARCQLGELVERALRSYRKPR